MTKGVRLRALIELRKWRAVFETRLGVLCQADCLELLRALPTESVDLVFLDPPFNLGKKYGRRVNDKLDEAEYLAWCRMWLAESVRVLKKGGAVFVYHLPETLLVFGNYLIALGMEFRHWIAIDFKSVHPIKGRLYPAHYGLLYYTKGPARTFKHLKVPVPTCRHCGRDIKDYGGYRNIIRRSGGLNLSDLWTDLSPVRHKNRKHRAANELPEPMLERVLRLASRKGDLIVDPFAGAGTTPIVAERLGRRWIAGEIEDCRPIVNRFKRLGVGRAASRKKPKRFGRRS